MKAIERLFGLINAFFTLGLLFYIFKFAATISTVFGNLFGIFILILPIIIGAAFSFNHLIKKTKGLHKIDKILNAFALINLTILLIFFLLNLTT